MVAQTALHHHRTLVFVLKLVLTVLLMVATLVLGVHPAARRF